MEKNCPSFSVLQLEVENKLSTPLKYNEVLFLPNSFCAGAHFDFISPLKHGFVALIVNIDVKLSIHKLGSVNRINELTKIMEDKMLRTVAVFNSPRLFLSLQLYTHTHTHTHTGVI